MKIVNVILTGGVGSRLWPLSRKSRPKQYIDLFDKECLFIKTVLRNQNLTDEFLIVGNIDNSSLSNEVLAKTDLHNYLEIIEAVPRNTAAAICFAALSLNYNDVMLVTPSDHVIENMVKYNEAVEEAIDLAKKDYIVTFGLTPTKPETGFGYIQYNGKEVVSFREKPSQEIAESFIKDGNFLWNSGMFCLKAGVFLDELKKYSFDVFKASKEAMSHMVEHKLPYDKSLLIPSISVDYAVLEKTDKIKVVKSDFAWSDLGSFESIYDYLVSKGYPIDDNGNMVIGNTQHTEFVGVNNCILVITEDAILVLNKEYSQKVKDIYENLVDKRLT